MVRFRPIRTPSLADILDLVLKECSYELERTSLPGEYQFSVILHCGDELLDHLEGQFFQDVQNQCQHWRSTSWSSLYDRDRVLSETRVGALVLPKITRASWVRSYLISKVTTRAS